MSIVYKLGEIIICYHHIIMHHLMEFFKVLVECQVMEINFTSFDHYKTLMMKHIFNKHKILMTMLFKLMLCLKLILMIWIIHMSIISKLIQYPLPFQFPISSHLHIKEKLMEIRAMLEEDKDEQSLCDKSTKKKLKSISKKMGE